MSDNVELTPAVVETISLERALKDVEVANLRAVQLTGELLSRDERIARLEKEIVMMKRVMNPRRRAEHILRKNHSLFIIARGATRGAKRILGR